MPLAETVDHAYAAKRSFEETLSSDCLAAGFEMGDAGTDSA